MVFGISIFAAILMFAFYTLTGSNLSIALFLFASMGAVFVVKNYAMRTAPCCPRCRNPFFGDDRFFYWYDASSPWHCVHCGIAYMQDWDSTLDL